MRTDTGLACIRSQDRSLDRPGSADHRYLCAGRAVPTTAPAPGQYCHKFVILVQQLAIFIRNFSKENDQIDRGANRDGAADRPAARPITPPPDVDTGYAVGQRLARAHCQTS